MPYVIREARPDDYPAITGILNLQNEPDHHVAAERLLHGDRAFRAADPTFRRVVAEAYGEVVATGTIRSSWAGPPQDGRVWVLLHERDDHRGRGADSTLLRHLLDAVPAGTTEVLTCIREDYLDAAGFLRPHGFEEAFRSWGAHLDPPIFDPAPFEALTARLERAGIRIARYPELPDADQRDARLLALQRELERDATAFPPVVPRRHDDIASSDTIPDGTFVAVAADGAYVGLTSLQRGNDASSLAFGFTGVRRDQRRRGIATALKARAVAAAAARGCTDLNAGGGGTLGAPIVRANRALGFSIEPSWVTLLSRL